MRGVVTGMRAGCVPLATAFVVGIAHSFSPGFGLLFFGIGIVLAAGWALFMTGRVLMAAWRRAWRRSVSTALVLLGVWPFAVGLLLAGDYVHLTLMYPFYASRISTAQHNPGASFDWGSTGFGGSANSQRTLVYDVTGELGREVGVRSMPQEPALQVVTNHLVGRFYIVEMSW